MAGVITNLHDSGDPFGGEGGRAFSNAAMWRAGGAVAFGEEFLGDDKADENFQASARTLGIRVAHEFAHTLGLAHDDATVDSDDGPLTSFMSVNGGTAPILGETEPSLDPSITQYDAWASNSPRKWVPRPSGFAYRGCIDNTSCPTGLECVEQLPGGRICR